MRDDTDTKRVTIDGYAYVSSNGQLVIDRHPTDEVHLLAEQTRGSQPLYDCRTYLVDLIPGEWLGKRGRFIMSSFVNHDGVTAALQLIFTPRCQTCGDVTVMLDELLPGQETSKCPTCGRNLWEKRVLAGEQGDLPAASAR